MLLLVGTALLLLTEAGILAYWYKTNCQADARTDLDISRSEAMIFVTYVQSIGRNEASLATDLAALKPGSTDEANRLLAAHAKGDPAVAGLQLADAQGAVIGASDPADAKVSVEQADYFRRALKSQRTIVSDLFMRQGKPVFAVCTFIPRGPEHEPWIVVAFISPERLDAIGLRMPPNEEGALVLFDTQGAEVYRNPPCPMDWQARHNSETPELIKRALAGQEATGTVRLAGENEDELAARVPVPEFGWVIGMGHPKRLVTEPLVKGMEIAGGLDLGALALAFGVALVLSGSIPALTGRLRHTMEEGRRSSSSTVTASPEQAESERRQGEGRLPWVTDADGIEPAQAEMLARFVQESPNPILRISADHVLVFANKAAWPILHTWNCQVSQTVPPAIGDIVSRALHTGQGCDTEIRCLEGKVFLTAFAPIVEGGYVNVYSRDITQRHRVEAALRESQAQLDHLAGNVREVFWLGEPDWNRLLYVNKAYEEVWGLSRESLYRSPRSWMEAVVEEDKPAVVAALGREVLGRQPTVLPEYRIRKPDGTVRWILARAWPILDGSGVLTAVAGIAEDITDRKRVEEAEAKYRSLAEDALVGVYLIQGGRIVYANPRLAEIFGYAQEELLAIQSVLDLVTPEDRSLVQEKMARRESGQTLREHYGFRGVRKDGQIVDLELLGSVTIYNGRPALIGTLLDVTARKRTDEALKKTTAELVRSNQDLEQFAGIVSHDLQEPLRMVSGFLQLLAKSQLGPDEGEFITFAVEGAQRMQRMIHDLLAYARLGSTQTQFQDISMQEALDEALANLQVRVEKAGALVTHDDLPVVRGNITLLTQVFQNLVGNALKFHGDRRPEIHIAASRRTDGWEFSIRDNGIGIDPSQHDRVFQIFQRLHTRKEYSGSGVGLAICKRIVQLHGGDIRVESRPGEGATFYFTIPDRSH